MRRTSLLLLTCALLLHPAENSARPGLVERIKVHGVSLEGNLSGDAADRDVSVYLPHSYATAKKKRYPVLYLLHGFTDSDEKWFGHNGVKHWMHLPTVLDKAMAAGAAEMIVVQPNAYTRFEGSFYSNSVTTGNWEDFIARDLVAYIDQHYRTLPALESRGLAGHSMGGYGTIRIGMKHPDVFSSIYALAPCCLAAADPRSSRPGAEKSESFTTIEEFKKSDFFTKANFALAAAWSPNPKKPPFFLDLPTKGGQGQTSVAGRWSANAPLAMLDQYIGNLKKLKGIALDVGDKDGLSTGVKDLSAALTLYGIEHFFEIYPGDHINKIGDRIELKVMPFFSQRLKAAKK
jgi:enterochelin esterase-like enzyme